MILDGKRDGEQKANEKPTRQCKWLAAVEGKRNSGQELVTLRDISLEDCKKKLDEDPQTKYRSIEYHKTAKICYLQQADRHTHRLTVNDANYVYIEYDCSGNTHLSRYSIFSVVINNKIVFIKLCHLSILFRH